MIVVVKSIRICFDDCTVYVPTGILSLTVTVSSEINATLESDSSFVLNCTYRLETKKYVDVVYVNGYDIYLFSPFYFSDLE